jgi:hypothetical protein
MFLKRQHKLYLGAILLIICLIAAGSFVYINYYGKEKTKKGEAPVEPQIDNRVSPLVTQGLSLEIDRIRSRGLLDKILQKGTSWKNKPQFYFITNIDEKEYISKNEESAGGVSAQLFFNTWDSILKERRVKSAATEQDQLTADIAVSIMEIETSGLLGRRTQDVEKEHFQITYDYRTGHWSGDDSRNDSDGYGHYVGENYEIWFNVIPNDYNHDGIPYWTEVNVYHLDPKVDHSQYDPNNDGIPIPWDWKWGYNPFAFDNHSKEDPDQDGLTNLQEYQMGQWFSDPNQKDIYIEADGMKKGGLFDPAHVFWEESQQIVIERYRQHGINVYIDYGWPNGPADIGGGELLDHYETLSQDSGVTLEFYRHHFSDSRKGTFRYLIIGHNAGFAIPQEFNNYDTMAVDSSLYKAYFKRSAFTPRTQRIVLASATMHELGHTLGIGNWNVGGNDNLTFAQGKQAKQQFLDQWGNYKSVMNYYYIWDKTIVNYSDGSHGTNDVNDWALFNFSYFKQESPEVEVPP